MKTMVKSAFTLSLLFGVSALHAQFYSMSRPDELPEVYKLYDIQDSIQRECMQNWQNNLEWQECNIKAIDFWKFEEEKAYSKLLLMADSTLKQSIVDYHIKWAENLEAQRKLFFDLYFDRQGYFGREYYIGYGGVIAASYKEHAYDLQMLLYYLKEN